ncbi:TetR family transcriptional regulator [Rhodococcus sp. SMB37]|nr:TetR family transcriptional regulator [Rhodococcus sp. SMB37]
MSRAEERAVERSVAVQRSRSRVENQIRAILDAAHRLVEAKGDAFTTQELAKEAGVALQTFYRYFASKDELLLAVISDGLSDACRQMTAAADGLTDPLQRLRFFITASLGGRSRDPERHTLAQFIVATHWRLHRVFPKELAEADRPLVDLIHTEIRAAADAGLVTSTDTEQDAWFIVELTRSVYHHYAYAAGTVAEVQEQMWHFCLRALGGTVR